jgi:hypothetical protein
MMRRTGKYNEAARFIQASCKEDLKETFRLLYADFFFIAKDNNPPDPVGAGKRRQARSG